LTPARPRCFGVARKPAPEDLVLAVADVEAEDLPGSWAAIPLATTTAIEATCTGSLLVAAVRTLR
jgi:hypothetical protein